MNLQILVLGAFFTCTNTSVSPCTVFTAEHYLICRRDWVLHISVCACLRNTKRDLLQILTLFTCQTVILSSASWTQMLAKHFFNGSKLWHSILWIYELYEWRLTSSQHGLGYLEYIHPSNPLKTPYAKFSHTCKNTQRDQFHTRLFKNKC